MIANEQLARQLLSRSVEAGIAAALASRSVLPNCLAFTIAQAAIACGVTEKTIRNAIYRGELKAVKRGGAYLIRRDALLRWLDD